MGNSWSNDDYGSNDDYDGSAVARLPLKSLSHTPAVVKRASNYTQVAVADFNLDGHDDIAVTSMTSDNVWIYLTNTAGDLSFSKVFDGNHDGPRGPSAADFDGDGIPDLVFCSQSSAKITVLYNDLFDDSTPDSFTPRVIRNTGSYGKCHHTNYIDIDLDGDLDIIYTRQESGDVFVLFNPQNRWSGKWSRLRLGSNEAGTHAVAVAKGSDVLATDLVVCMDDKPARWLRTIAPAAGEPPTTAAEQMQVFGSDKDSRFAAFGDFDGDGLTDLVICYKDHVVDEVRVHRRLDDTQFAWPPTTSLVLNLPGASRDKPMSVVARDLNGDGALDLVVAYEDAGVVVVWENICNFTFQPHVANYSSITRRGGWFNQPWIVDVAAVFTGGGSADTIFMSSRDGSVLALINLSLSPTIFRTPIPTPSPTRTPIVAVSLSISGITCVDFNGTVLALALASVIVNSSFSNPACTDVMSSSVSITNEVSVPLIIAARRGMSSVHEFVSDMLNASVVEVTHYYKSADPWRVMRCRGGDD